MNLVEPMFFFSLNHFDDPTGCRVTALPPEPSSFSPASSGWARQDLQKGRAGESGRRRAVKNLELQVILRLRRLLNRGNELGCLGEDIAWALSEDRPFPEHVLHHVLQGRELLFGNPVDAVHGARIDCDLDALLVREPLAKDSCSPRAFHPEDRWVAPEAPLAPVVERETGETVSKKEEHGA